MLKVYQSPDLAQLAAKFNEVYCAAQPTVFEKSTVIVPSLAMRDWLEQYMARAQGISAQIDYPLWIEFERGLIEQIFDSIHPDTPRSRLTLSSATMRWAIFAYLTQHSNHFLQDEQHPMHEPLKLLLNGATAMNDNAVQRLWAYAGETARLFAAYLHMRPDWLSQWNKGEGRTLADLLDKHALKNSVDKRATAEEPMPLWLQAHYEMVLQSQYFLWRQCLSDIYAEREQMEQVFKNSIHQNKIDRDAVPNPLYVFTLTDFTPRMLAFIRTLGEVIDIHLFHHSISNHYFSDIVDPKWLRTLHPSESEGFSVGHPLAARFGKIQRDIQRLFEHYEISQDGEQFQSLDPIEKPPQTLLAQLQQDIRNMNEVPHLTPLDDEDDSLRIHGCHGLLRQLEVLRGEIVRWLNADPNRKLSDILILLPDLQDDQDLIRSVFPLFGHYDGYTLPARITGVSTPAIENLWQAVGGIYDLPTGAFDAQTVCDFLLLEDTCLAYGISHEAMQRICEQLIEAGFRRGFDEAHLRELIDTDDGDSRYTFCYALDRLIAGYTMPEISIYLPQDNNDTAKQVVPAPNLGYDDFTALNALCRFAEEVREIQTLQTKQHTALTWLEMITTRLEKTFAHAVGEAAYQAIEALLRDLFFQLGGGYIEDIQVQTKLTLPLNFVLRTVRETIRGIQPSSEPSGVITIGKLSALRGLPYKLIAFVGADADRFPSRTMDKRYNLINIDRRRYGDKHHENDDLSAFLATLTAATESYWIFYTAYDPIDGEARQPATPIQELLDYLDKHLGEPHHYHQQHLPDPFHPDDHNTHPAPLWRRVQKARQKQHNESVKWHPLVPNHFANTTQNTSISEREVIDFTTIQSGIIAPAQTYLRSQHITLPRFAQQTENIEPLAVDNLSHWAIDNALIACEDDHTPLTRLPLLPVGAYGRVLFETRQTIINERRQQLIARYAPQQGTLTVTRSQHISIANRHYRAELPQDPHQPWLKMYASKNKAKHIIRAWLAHLLWQQTGANQTSICNFASKTQEKTGETIIFPAIASTEAEQMLRQWLAYYDSLTHPPLFDIQLLWDCWDKPENINETINKWLNQINDNDYDDAAAFRFLFRGWDSAVDRENLKAKIAEAVIAHLPLLQEIKNRNINIQADFYKGE